MDKTASKPEHRQLPCKQCGAKYDSDPCLFPKDCNCQKQLTAIPEALHEHPAPEPMGCEPKGCPTPGACSCPPTASLLVKEAAMLAVNEIGAELGLYSSIGDHQHANEIVCKHFAGFTHSPVMADAEAAALQVAIDAADEINGRYGGFAVSEAEMIGIIKSHIVRMHSPAPGMVSELEKLVEKWRNHGQQPHDDYYAGVWDSFQDCANELEAALKASRE